MSDFTNDMRYPKRGSVQTLAANIASLGLVITSES